MDSGSTIDNLEFEQKFRGLLWERYALFCFKRFVKTILNDIGAFTPGNKMSLFFRFVNVLGNIIQNLIDGFSPSFVGFSSNNIFFGAKNYAIIVNMTLFFSNSSHVFELPDSLDWFKKKWNELETDFKQFQSVTFFSSKSASLCC